MKTKILIILLFICANVYSQQVSYQIYIPLRTHHLDRSDKMMREYSGSEGGNAGLILGRKIQYEEFFLESNAGLIVNSFGQASILLVSGIGITENEGFIDISLSVGIASGYQKLYRARENRERVPKLFSDNGIAPVALLSLSMTKGLKVGKINISPMIIISPVYINGGLKIKL